MKNLLENALMGQLTALQSGASGLGDGYKTSMIQMMGCDECSGGCTDDCGGGCRGDCATNSH